VLADPQTITIAATPYTLPRVGADLNAGTFRTVDGMYTESISHAYAKRVRRTARLDYKVLSPDVMDSSVNTPYSSSVYLVMDNPTVGITRAVQGNIVNGFLAYLTASSNLVIGKILDGES